MRTLNDCVLRGLEKEKRSLQAAIARADAACYWHLPEERCDQIIRANRQLYNEWRKQLDHIEAVLGL